MQKESLLSQNAMRRFELFIGIWNTRGQVFETKSGPATTLTATDVYRWLPGNHFIIHEADARFGANVSRSVEIVSYDAKKKQHVSVSFNDAGDVEHFEVELRGYHWRIRGKLVRFDGNFNKAGTRLVGLWELRSKGAGWQPWIDLQLDRA